jgi:hypothetical protein
MKNMRAENMRTENMRTFSTGATRDTEDGKLDFDGFLSPDAMLAFARYMHRHRRQSDGTLRAGDNWKKGIPLSAYRKSMWRHFFDVWQMSQDLNEAADLIKKGDDLIELEEALCALLFNVQGVLHDVARRNKAKGDEKRQTGDGAGKGGIGPEDGW